MRSNDIKILVARRAYEFRLDELRLSLICTVPVRDAIQNLFSFASAQIATPIALFGDVVQAMPPGAVFNYGFITLDDGQVTPIRLLHFEPTRIVIDVAGASTTIDEVYARICELLSHLKASDGSPVLGEPIRTVDHSEASIHLPVLPSRLLSAALVDAVSSLSTLPQSYVLVPAIRIVMQEPDKKHAGTEVTGSGLPWIILEMRVGTEPEEGAFFSAASCDTDAHIGYLSQLSDSFSA